MAITNYKLHSSRTHFILSFDMNAAGDLLDMQFPAPVREYTIQRALGAGVSAASLHVRNSHSPTVPSNINWHTMSTDGFSGSLIHILHRVRFFLASMTGTGTISVALAGRKVT